jgi:hypothetical protein
MTSFIVVAVAVADYLWRGGGQFSDRSVLLLLLLLLLKRL